jgi:hypothetical protein
MKDEVRQEAHVLLLRWAGASGVTHVAGFGPLRWAGRDQWPMLVSSCDLPDVDLLLTGYLEGWIPDGPITLE